MQNAKAQTTNDLDPARFVSRFDPEVETGAKRAPKCRMSQSDPQTTIPLWQGKPITAGWWWLQFPDGPGPRHWDGTFWDHGSYFATAEDYADNPILGPCPLPGAD